MGTPRENLKRRIERLRATSGPDSLLLKDYEAQLRAMPKPSESTPDRFVGAGTPQEKPKG